MSPLNFLNSFDEAGEVNPDIALIRIIPAQELKKAAGKLLDGTAPYWLGVNLPASLEFMDASNLPGRAGISFVPAPPFPGFTPPIRLSLGDTSWMCFVNFNDPEVVALIDGCEKAGRVNIVFIGPQVRWLGTIYLPKTFFREYAALRKSTRDVSFVQTAEMAVVMTHMMSVLELPPEVPLDRLVVTLLATSRVGAAARELGFGVPSASNPVAMPVTYGGGSIH